MAFPQMVQLEQPRIFQQQHHQHFLHQQQRLQQQFMNGGRGTPMGHGGGIEAQVQVIKPKKKKKKRLQQLNRTNIDDSLFDQDEVQWFSQFGNGHQHSEPESMQTQFFRRGGQAPTSSRKYNSIETPGIDNRGLYQRRGPEIMSSHPETESESMAQFQSKRAKSNNMMLGAAMGRNLNNNTALGLQQKRNNLFNSGMMEEGKYLPPLNNVAQSLNNSMVSRNQLGARTQLDNYSYLNNPQSEVKQHRKIFALSAAGVDSSVNYHSQSSTKLSELHGPGHKRTLQPLKNTLAQRLDNSYGLTDINERVEGGISNQESRNFRPSMLSKYGTDSEALAKPQVINLGGGLALKRNNPQLISKSIVRQGPNLQSFGRSNQQTDSLITFRDDDNPQHRLVGQQVSRTNQSTDNIRKPMKRQIHQDSLPQIQLINMEIDTDVLEKLQSGQLSDEQKHEIIYEILRGHLQKNSGTISSNSPSNERDGVQAKYPTGQMIGLKSSNLLRKKRDLDENFSSSLPMTQVHNKKLPSRLNEDSDKLEEEVRAFKKNSQSPGSSNERKIESVVNNLTASRHVNRYCRHCYLKALQEEQRTKKNHLLIYDANNCQRFIEKIKKINKKMQRKHQRGVIESSNNGYRGGYISPSQDESQQNSARLIHLNKLRAQLVRNSSNLKGVNQSTDSMMNLKGHKRTGSVETRKFFRARNSQSFGGNEVMDSQITLGERRKKKQLNGEGQHMKTTSLNAGGYTIDVIR